ncbi:MAG: alanine dehydrogenase, partial [Clostridia bacterium]|nr:alanine dehydrogenase [Clostridia bacterium]
TVGTSACKAAYGLGAYVTVLDRSARRLTHLDDMFGGRIQTLISTPPNLHTMLAQADLIVGAVLEPGNMTPKLVTRTDLQRMKPGTVIVDVSVDQGGCFETIRPTTHDDPSYIIDGIVHYGVANMSAAVSRTATFALSSATLAYGLALADDGLEALRGDAGFAMGLNTHNGLCTCRGVANACGLDYVPPGDALK